MAPIKDGRMRVASRYELNAQYLRRLREERGMVPQSLADAIGTSEGMIRKYEKGACVPRGDRLLELCDALGCEPRDLFVKERMG